MELKLKVGRDAVGYRPVQFCKTAFLDVVDVPEGIKTVYLVFSKGKPRDDGYAICPPRLNYFSGERHSLLTRIKGNPLYNRTRAYLAKQHDAGYRSVHVEYES